MWLLLGLFVGIALLSTIAWQQVHKQTTVCSESSDRQQPLQSFSLGLMLQDNDDGLYVLAVMDSGAAAEAGIRPGDLILRLNDAPLTSIVVLDDLLTLRDPDDPLLMTVNRSGCEVTYDLSGL